jgi:CMP-N,N'-diacetyllegionaminic acid synthase
MKSVAFIPARSGSKRVPNKNIMNLGGHPMLAYSICAALDSGVFESVICATDSEQYADIARYYGAEVPFLRSNEISRDSSPDIDWVTWMLTKLEQQQRSYDIFSILRPTSPFRLPETIQRAWGLFLGDTSADSLRAVQKCQQHPGKMWVVHGKRMLPLIPLTNDNVPWHSNQYAALPEIYVQDASLEIAWTRVALEKKSIAGDAIIPFISKGREGFDINNHEDMLLANYLISTGNITLPEINKSTYQL